MTVAASVSIATKAAQKAKANFPAHVDKSGGLHAALGSELRSITDSHHATDSAYTQQLLASTLIS